MVLAVCTLMCFSNECGVIQGYKHANYIYNMA